MDDYTFRHDYETRMAELQDIAAMDRLAADLQPQSVLSRWAERRSSEQRPRRSLSRLLRHAA